MQKLFEDIKAGSVRVWLALETSNLKHLVMSFLSEKENTCKKGGEELFLMEDGILKLGLKHYLLNQYSGLKDQETTLKTGKNCPVKRGHL